MTPQPPGADNKFGARFVALTPFQMFIVWFAAVATVVFLVLSIVLNGGPNSILWTNSIVVLGVTSAVVGLFLGPRKAEVWENTFTIISLGLVAVGVGFTVVAAFQAN